MEILKETKHFNERINSELISTSPSLDSSSIKRDTDSNTVLLSYEMFNEFSDGEFGHEICQ